MSKIVGALIDPMVPLNKPLCIAGFSTGQPVLGVGIASEVPGMTLVASVKVIGATSRWPTTDPSTSQVAYSVPIGKGGWYMVIGYTVITVAADVSSQGTEPYVLFIDQENGVAGGPVNSCAVGLVSTLNVVGATNTSGNPINNGECAVYPREGRNGHQLGVYRLHQ